MKKLFYSAFVASMMLMASSCSQEAEVVDNPVSGEETQSVTFTIETGAVESRTAGDGKSVDRVNYEVWSNIDDNDPTNDVLVISSIEGRNARVGSETYKPQPVENGKATVKLNLVRNVAYDVTFWADDTESPYEIGYGLDKVTYKNSAELLSNKETYDAFYQTLYGFKVNNGTKTVILKRPFAQINVGTTVEDWDNAIALGVAIDKSEVKVYNVNSVFNAHTRAASEPKDLIFKLNDILQETFQIKDENGVYTSEYYKFLGMNYMFADTTAVNATESGKTLHSLEIALNMGNTEINKLIVNNMPMQRNWRTNIVGNLLTGDEEFQIIVDPEFDGEYNTHIWDGESIHKPKQDADGNWVITTAAELAWISKASNEGLDAANVLGRAATGHSFAGETIKLAYDIDWNGKEWTPIGSSTDNAFMGSFDGCGHTIKNVMIKATSNNTVRGFIQTVKGATIKNLILDNVSVDAGKGENAYVGALVGESFGTFKLENVKVQNSEVKGTNKVGGMVGFVREDQIIAENCHVINTNIETHDVSGESGLAGGFIGYIGCAEGKIKNSEISNCSVEGGTFTFINSTNSVKRSNSKFIGGIGGDAGEKVILTNCSTTNITYNETVTDYVSDCGELVGGCRDKFVLVVNNGVATSYYLPDNTSNNIENLQEALNNANVVTLRETIDITDETTHYLHINNEVVISTEDNELKVGDSKNYGLFCNANSNVTFENANIVSEGGGIVVRGGAKAVFNSGSVKIESTETSHRHLIYAYGNGTTVTIKDGTFSFDAYRKRTYGYVADGAILYIEGGVFGPAPNHPTDTNAPFMSEGGQIIITGGTFGFDPTYWVAEGYKAEKNGSTWTVTKVVGE